MSQARRQERDCAGRGAFPVPDNPFALSPSPPPLPARPVHTRHAAAPRIPTAWKATSVTPFAGNLDEKLIVKPYAVQLKLEEEPEYSKY